VSSAISCADLTYDVLISADRLCRNSAVKAVLRRGTFGVVVPAAFTRQKRGEVTQRRDGCVRCNAPRVERFGTVAVELRSAQPRRPRADDVPRVARD
jgi:hypothetical protein